jgi:hypothetical protein
MAQEMLELERWATAPGVLEAALRERPDVRTERAARDDLRRQIARLEGRLAELFASAFPRQGFEWRVGAAGGPRVLGVPELERVRDALHARVREAQEELGRIAEAEETSRVLLEEMIAAPEAFPWMRISNEHLGEPGCRHYHSRPRWGILGMLFGWWRVKLSSGCPLVRGGRPLQTVASRCPRPIVLLT